MNTKITELEGLANQFRCAIEACEKSSLPITFMEFPRGSCGDASLLLGEYLHENGLGEFTYVCGECYGPEEGDYQSHAWIEQDDIIIDITADQFPNVKEPVIVTTNHSWHEQFERDLEHEARLHIFDEQTAQTLQRAYQQVKHQLPKGAGR